MKRFLNILFALLLTVCVTLGVTSCGSNTVKIGVLVADDSGEEAKGFKNYMENYIAKEYNVEIVYSAKLENAEDATAQAKKFVGENCKAIIDMADKNRADLAKYCEENKVYFAIGSGVMSDSDFEACKGYKYFVGQIGPSNQTEYEAGLAMGEYYKDTKKVTKVGIYGAFVPNPMHVYRLAGILVGLGDSYKEKSTEGEIVAQIFADNGTVDGTQITGSVAVDYFAGYSDTINDQLDTVLADNIDALLSVGMATTFFTSSINAAGIEFSDIDSFTEANGEAMNTGKLGYLAGKYSSSLGPIFAAIMNAINGNEIRDEEGNAINLSQSYLVATSYAQFQKLQSADAGTNPIFNKTVLDTVIGSNVTYAQFKAFVEQNRTIE